MVCRTTVQGHLEHAELFFGAAFGGLRVLLDREVTRVGRGDDCDVQLPHPDVSQRHAELRRLGPSHYQLCDRGSRNGTFVNGTPVATATLLRLGDSVRFGQVLSAKLLLHDPTRERIQRRKRLLVLGRMCAGVSNELCNMAAVVLTNSDYLVATMHRAPQRRAAIADIRDSAIRASRLLKQIANFSVGRGQQGAIDVSAVCVDVVETVSRVLADGVRVEADIAPALICAGHELDLRLALLHLSINAHNSLDRRGLLRMSAEKNASEAELRITLRGDKSGARGGDDRDGTSAERVAAQMCLADVGEVVAAMGGSVSHAVDDGGTTATIVLPALAAWGGHITRTFHAVAPPAPSMGAPRSLTVLVVDDEPALRRGVCRVLQRAGHQGHEAETGKQTLAVHRRERPDVVLLDVRLAGEDGAAVLEELLVEEHAPAVVMVTGALSPALERELLRMGACACIEKPWTRQQLLDAIRTAAEGR